jgi:hypothetical protein
MMEIVENPELLVPLKKKSKEIIQQMNLDMDHHTDEILKLYYEILTQK